MSHGAIIILIVVLLLLFAYPRTGAFNANWGYYPMGGLGVVLIILVVMLLLGVL